MDMAYSSARAASESKSKFPWKVSFQPLDDWVMPRLKLPWVAPAVLWATAEVLESF